MRRRQAILAIPGLVTFEQAVGQSTGPVEGQQYTVLRAPVPPIDPGKIDVIEFFSYGCPACNAFDSPVERWKASLPTSVAFRRVPVPFLFNAENFQRTYYALESTGTLDKMHPKIFEAFHVKRQRLTTSQEIASVVGNAGGDPTKFLGVFNSFSMSVFLNKAKLLASAYQIDSLPTLAIAGRYLTSPALAGGHAQALATADYLLQKAARS